MDASTAGFQKTLRVTLKWCVVLGLCLQALPQLSFGQTYFISDELQIPLRSGASRQHRIKTFLTSGTAVISTNNPEESSEWLEVRYDGGQGWLQREHVKKSPTAQIKLTAAEEKIEKLEKTKNAQEQALDEATAQIAALEESLRRAQSSLNETRAEFNELQSMASDTVAVNNRNTSLTEKLSLMEVREQQLKMENHDLRKDQRRRGMIQGALAVIAGALLAVIIPRLSHKKQRSDWM